MIALALCSAFLKAEPIVLAGREKITVAFGELCEPSKLAEGEQGVLEDWAMTALADSPGFPFLPTEIVRARKAEAVFDRSIAIFWTPVEFGSGSKWPRGWKVEVFSAGKSSSQFWLGTGPTGESTPLRERSADDEFNSVEAAATIPDGPSLVPASDPAPLEGISEADAPKPSSTRLLGLAVTLLPTDSGVKISGRLGSTVSGNCQFGADGLIESLSATMAWLAPYAFAGDASIMGKFKSQFSLSRSAESRDQVIASQIQEASAAKSALEKTHPGNQEQQDERVLYSLAAEWRAIQEVKNLTESAKTGLDQGVIKTSGTLVRQVFDKGGRFERVFTNPRLGAMSIEWSGRSGAATYSVKDMRGRKMTEKNWKGVVDGPFMVFRWDSASAPKDVVQSGLGAGAQLFYVLDDKTIVQFMGGLTGEPPKWVKK